MGDVEKAECRFSIQANRSCAWGARVHIVFRNRRPRASLSVLLGVSDGFALSSYGFGSCVTGVLVSWGCVWGLVKAPHLSGIVLLSSDPSGKDDGSSKLFGMHTIFWNTHFLVYCCAQLPPPMHSSLIWFVMSSNKGSCGQAACGVFQYVCPSPVWTNCLLITKACRIFLQGVTPPLPQNS